MQNGHNPPLINPAFGVTYEFFFKHGLLYDTITISLLQRKWHFIYKITYRAFQMKWPLTPK
jgi:hypothetical protein